MNIIIGTTVGVALLVIYSLDAVKFRSSLSSKRWMLFLAGSTSSGKSTLLNALLGEPVLPTSHDAATRALCEIKCSENSSKKYAIIHIGRGKSKKSERIDLNKPGGHARFVEFITRGVESGSVVTDTSTIRAEVYWPAPFLKVVTVWQRETDGRLDGQTGRQTDRCAVFFWVFLCTCTGTGTSVAPQTTATAHIVFSWPDVMWFTKNKTVAQIKKLPMLRSVTLTWLNWCSEKWVYRHSYSLRQLKQVQNTWQRSRIQASKWPIGHHRWAISGPDTKKSLRPAIRQTERQKLSDRQASSPKVMLLIYEHFRRWRHWLIMLRIWTPHCQGLRQWRKEQSGRVYIFLRKWFAAICRRLMSVLSSTSS